MLELPLRWSFGCCSVCLLVVALAKVKPVCDIYVGETLTLKEPSRIAADDTFIYLLVYLIFRR